MAALPPTLEPPVAERSLQPTGGVLNERNLIGLTPGAGAFALRFCRSD
jgi:hypothetical protein